MLKGGGVSCSRYCSAIIMPKYKVFCNCTVCFSLVWLMPSLSFLRGTLNAIKLRFLVWLLTFLCPGGTAESSPAIYRWDCRPRFFSPVGTAEKRCVVDSGVQSSLRDFTICFFNPAMNCWATLSCPSGTKLKNFLNLMALRVPPGNRGKTQNTLNQQWEIKMKKSHVTGLMLFALLLAGLMASPQSEASAPRTDAETHKTTVTIEEYKRKNHLCKVKITVTEAGKQVGSNYEVHTCSGTFFSGDATKALLCQARS